VDPLAEACSRTEFLHFPGADPQLAGHALVFVPAPNKVVVAASCWNCPTGGNRTFQWTSTNNGSSFAAPTPIGLGTESRTDGDGLWLDSLGIFVAANGGHVRATSSATDVGPGAQFAPPGFSFGSQVVEDPATGQLVAAANDLGSIEYGAYSGVHTVAGINALDSDWAAERSLSAPEPGNSESALNAGASGVFLTYRSRSASGSALGMRRFDPGSSSFGPPAYVQGADPIDSGRVEYPDSFQSQGGRVHLVWRSLFDGGRLRYRTSPNGVGFGPAGTLATGESFVEPEIAVGDETGFVVWTNGFTVRVVRVDPREDPTRAGSGGTPTASPVGKRPRVRGARIGDRTLLPGQGTTFRFSSSDAGRAVLTIEKRFKGLKVKVKTKTKRAGKKKKTTCLPQTRKRLRALRRKSPTPRAYRRTLKKRTCHAFRRIGEIRQRVTRGANTIAFNGRVAGRKLSRGSYRARLVVTDSAGRRSRAESIRFKVVGSKKAKKRRGGRR
jgi:hypothetical protein